MHVVPTAGVVDLLGSAEENVVVLERRSWLLQALLLGPGRSGSAITPLTGLPNISDSWLKQPT